MMLSDLCFSNILLKTIRANLIITSGKYTSQKFLSRIESTSLQCFGS